MFHILEEVPYLYQVGNRTEKGAYDVSWFNSRFSVLLPHPTPPSHLGNILVINTWNELGVA